MNMLLHKCGWSVAEQLPRDVSPRQYTRVQKPGKTAILMTTVPDTAENPEMHNFVKIADWLRSIGLKAPEIYDIDYEHGFMVIEDFGSINLKQHGNRDETYPFACDVLEHIETHDAGVEALGLPDYYDSHIHKGHRRIIDWYLPLIRKSKNEDGVVEEYLAVWKEVEQNLPPCPQGFLHIDYHAENLMSLPEEQGIKRCGILDFQGAMKGPKPYDLANLLEDARIDIPLDFKEQVLANKDEAFRLWFRVLATQFHCRVIGQFIKIAIEKQDTRYLKYIPRLENYLREGMKDPVLKPLKGFFESLKLDFSGLEALNGDEAKAFIRVDAF